MIRPAGPGDAAACCALVQAGFETYARFTPGWTAPDETTDQHVSEVATTLARPDGFGRVEEAPGGAIEGVVYWRPPDPDRASRDGWLPDAHLRCLFVDESRWGDGLAQRLHALAVEGMRERGIGAARLFTPSGQARARAFYERRGWRTRLEPYVDPNLGLELVEYELLIGSDAT